MIREGATPDRTHDARGTGGSFLLVALLAIAAATATGCTRDGSGDGFSRDGVSAGVAVSDGGSRGDAVAIAPVEVVDDAGRAVHLTAPATRVISLVPAATETLVAIGAEGLLVARTDYDDPSLGYLPSIGGGLTPSIEMIASLRPELVIAWEEAGTARVRPALESLGIPVFAVATADTTDIFANIERFGQLVGRQASAGILATEMRAALTEVRLSVEQQPSPSVLYMISLDPPMVAGPSLFIGELVGLAGGENIFGDVSVPSPQVSLEEIVRRRPEVVIVPASGGGTMAADRVAGQPGWRELAASGTRFHSLPADTLHRPGPAIVEAARRIRDVIHPELAPIP